MTPTPSSLNRASVSSRSSMAEVFWKPRMIPTLPVSLARRISAVVFTGMIRSACSCSHRFQSAMFCRVPRVFSQTQHVQLAAVRPPRCICSNTLRLQRDTTRPSITIAREWSEVISETRVVDGRGIGSGDRRGQLGRRHEFRPHMRLDVLDMPGEHAKPAGMADELYVQREMVERARPLVEAVELVLPYRLNVTGRTDDPADLAAVDEVRRIRQMPLDRQLHDRDRLAVELVTIRADPVMEVGRDGNAMVEQKLKRAAAPLPGCRAPRGRLDAGDRLQAFHAAHDLGLLLLRLEQKHGAVAVGVAAELVTMPRNLLHSLGIAIGGDTRDEERRADVVLLQQGQQRRQALADRERAVRQQDRALCILGLASEPAGFAIKA